MLRDTLCRPGGTREMMQPLSDLPACHLFGCGSAREAEPRRARDSPVARATGSPPHTHQLSLSWLRVAAASPRLSALPAARPPSPPPPAQQNTTQKSRQVGESPRQSPRASVGPAVASGLQSDTTSGEGADRTLFGGRRAAAHSGRGWELHLTRSADTSSPPKPPTSMESAQALRSPRKAQRWGGEESLVMREA